MPVLNTLTVHHVGYLVKKKNQAMRAFLGLGYVIAQDWVRDELRGIDIAFVTKDGLAVELVCPYRDDSDVSGLITRLKNSPYHICYVSRDLAADAEALRESGYLPMGGALPAPACGGHPVQFFMHPALGIIELIDKAFTFAQE